MNIVIVGAGSFGTALGNVLVKNNDLELQLLARKKNVVHSINHFNVNEKYFPNVRLDTNLKATIDKDILKYADVLFLAIPSSSLIDYINENRNFILEKTIIVVLSKGFGTGNKTIVESLKEIIDNPICSFKGPTFAADLIYNNPSAFTVASYDKGLFNIFKKIFNYTNIYLDFSTDILGVEVVSALKNIYAILLGIIDAYFNSANVRFLILTKAFYELKEVVIYFGGLEETLYKYCGFGDFGLTALNDLSRNRTIGLLIGKGFMNGNVSSSIILEGKRTLEIIFKAVCSNSSDSNKFYLIDELHKLFYSNYEVYKFIGNLFSKIREDN